MASSSSSSSGFSHSSSVAAAAVPSSESFDVAGFLEVGSKVLSGSEFGVLQKEVSDLGGIILHGSVEETDLVPGFLRPVTVSGPLGLSKSMGLQEEVVNGAPVDVCVTGGVVNPGGSSEGVLDGGPFNFVAGSVAAPVGGKRSSAPVFEALRRVRRMTPIADSSVSTGSCGDGTILHNAGSGQQGRFSACRDGIPVVRGVNDSELYAATVQPQGVLNLEAVTVNKIDSGPLASVGAAGSMVFNPVVGGSSEVIQRMSTVGYVGSCKVLVPESSTEGGG